MQTVVMATYTELITPVTDIAINLGLCINCCNKLHTCKERSFLLNTLHVYWNVRVNETLHITLTFIKETFNINLAK